MKRLIAITLVLVMVLTFVACGKSETKTDSKTASYQETITTAWLGLDVADPYGSTGAPTQFTTNMTFDTLTYINADTGEVCPELAKSWEDVSEEQNGGDWKITLESGVKFHNGDILTAEDVKFTWEYTATGAGNVIKPNAASTYVKDYEVVDDTTIIFHLETPMPDFPAYLETKIYSKNAFDTMDASEASVIGTGPYYFNTEMTRKGVQYAVTRFDEYWRGTEDYKSKNIVIKEMEDDNTRIAAFMAGELDFIFDVPSVSYSMLDETSGITLESRSGANSYYLGFNYKNKAFDDIRVRTAFMQAINSEDVVNVAFEGGVGGTVNNNFCVPTGLGYKDVDYVEFDLDAAKAAFKEAGLAGKELTLIYTPEKSKMAEAIQANLNAAGLNVVLGQKDAANWSAIKSAQDGFDLYLDYAAYQGALLYNFNRFFYTGGSSNVCGYHSDEYEALQDAVSNATSWDDMIKEFGTLQQWVATNLPLCPIVRNNMIVAYWDGVDGVQVTPSTNYLDFSTYYREAK